MNTVSTIIRRHLLAGRAISLPHLGALAVQLIPAQIVDRGSRLLSPRREVVFGQYAAIDIVDYIADELEVDQEQASSIYQKWIEQAKQGEWISVEGVGTIDTVNRAIEPNAEFATMLNPTPNEKVILHKSKNRQTILSPIRDNSKLLMILGILAAVGAAAYLIYHFADQITALLGKIR